MSLEWKATDNWRVNVAHGDCGRYKITKYDKGFVVNFCPPKRRWWPQVGTVATLQEAFALVQADNDRRLKIKEEAGK
jgi:hypothetical protein